MVPPAPGRISTTMCWAKPFAISLARMRATTSPLPPAGYGTTRRNGRVGKSAPAAAPASASARNAPAAPRLAKRPQIGFAEKGIAHARHRVRPAVVVDLRTLRRGARPAVPADLLHIVVELHGIAVGI